MNSFFDTVMMVAFISFVLFLVIGFYRQKYGNKE
jgi:hypothetical protein